MNPVLFFLSLLIVTFTDAAIGRFADDVAWLIEVQKPPTSHVEFDPGKMLPLLTSSGGTPITTLEQWKDRRKQLEKVWQDLLGPDLIKPAEDHVTTIRHERIGAVDRTLIRYQCEPGIFVEAYLLAPIEQTDTRSPGLVVLHHTAKAPFDEVAGVSGADSLQLGIKMAERGFVVICPRCFLWQDAENLNAAVDQFRKRNPRSLGMRKMLFDAQRATDVLASRPNVDPERLGAIGHSLGAKEVLYLMAFDQRIKAGVASEGGLCLKSTNWDAPWYLGPQINESAFERNHHELLALAAPRAMLIVGGESGPGAADGDRSWPHIQAAVGVYQLWKGNPRLGLLNHHQGHAIPDAAFQKMAEWLIVYLSPKNSSTVR